jgi:hypothetical protein
MAFDDFRRTAGQFGDPGHLAGPGLEPDPRGDRPAERGRVDVDPVAADHPGLLEPGDPLAHGRGGDAQSAGQFGGPQPRVGGQLLEDPDVQLIQRCAFRFGNHVGLPGSVSPW